MVPAEARAALGRDADLRVTLHGEGGISSSTPMKVTAPLLVLLGFIFAPIVGARPNVLVIMVDDLGYADLGVHGGREVRTPNIDALAAGGIRFEHCYSTPLCGPSRCQQKNIARRRKCSSFRQS
mgnify:CR=1 FL=1